MLSCPSSVGTSGLVAVSTRWRWLGGCFDDDYVTGPAGARHPAAVSYACSRRTDDRCVVAVGYVGQVADGL